MDEIVRARVSIKGRVQGVFFRAETSRMANFYNVSGYVRNMRDGSVEAVFEGEEENVMSAVEWCREGPPLSIVESVDLTWEPPEGGSGFAIRSG